MVDMAPKRSIEAVFEKPSGMLQLVCLTTLMIVDSTSLVDFCDVEIAWGYCSRGKLGVLSFIQL